ncbi:Uncharacterised protein [Klebsiella pneumoniae]|uniref:Uncharacterized protein n=1 Tax=Klebsiella pneumoniae TaxID=573 RepID=A0A486DPA4_KLEPN|nr:hypothetical protein AZ034_005048 [Pluralibacter gergoviae]QOQ32011.1 hypothetical protein PMIDBGBA_05306 [Klebsiella pneumoniae]CAI1188208.1 Uncharacterised protein [Serratia marcescens]VGH55735.1 Uncharacterised protein [Klebsiella quasipneumoniae]OUF44847.1 hypothetical protein AZ044_005100 [Pluralibacter gergoviae]
MFINPISDKLTNFLFKTLHCLIKLGISIIFKKPQYIISNNLNRSKVTHHVSLISCVKIKP